MVGRQGKNRYGGEQPFCSLSDCGSSSKHWTMLLVLVDQQVGIVLPNVLSLQLCLGIAMHSAHEASASQ